MAKSPLQLLQDVIVQCRRCPRLVAWREKVAQEKRSAYRGQDYWGQPIPSFGDPKARLLLCGLAPAAHGGNRTGRIFTGDRSGDFLMAALHRAGFANQPTSTHRRDGLALSDCYITACVRCPPPGNRPTPKERDNCLDYVAAELPFLTRVKVIVCLGQFAWDGMRRVLAALGYPPSRTPGFSHGAHTVAGPYHLLGCFHPSQQNTFTGRLTPKMLDTVFRQAKKYL